MKGYAGGLVVFDGKLAYRPGRGDPMIQVSASLFVGPREWEDEQR